MAKKLYQKWLKVNHWNWFGIIFLILLTILAVFSHYLTGVSTYSAGTLTIICFLLLIFQAQVSTRYSRYQLAKLSYLRDENNPDADLSDYPYGFNKLKLTANTIANYYTVHWYNYL